MGLSSLPNRQYYAGDGSSTIFAFSYEFFNPLDLQVYLFQTGSSLITPQVYGTNYSVTGVTNSAGIYPSGGNVAFTSAIPVGIEIVIVRSPSPVNIYSLLQNAPVNAPALVQQLDYLTALVQRCQDQIANCIQVPDGLGPNNGTYFSNVLPSGVNNPVNGNAPLVLNSGATGWQLGSVVAFNSSGGSGFVGTVPVSNGGTGQTGALTQNALIYAGTPSAMGVTNVGSLNWPMLSNGGGIAPAFAPLPISGSNIGIVGILAPSMGGTGNSSAVATGAIMYGSAAVWTNLPLGTQNLSMIAGLNGPTWAPTPLQSGAVSGALSTVNGGTGLSFTPAFGVIIYGSGSVFNQLLPGTNGQLLTFNGSSGYGWSSPFVNPMTTPGDTMYGGVAGAVTRLPAGQDSKVLVYSSSLQSPTWASVTPQAFTGAFPTITIFNSGASQSFTASASTAFLVFEIYGAGGGGGGSGANATGATASTAGANSLLQTSTGSTIVTAAGGGAPASNIIGGAGGSVSFGGPVVDLGSMPGGAGGASLGQLSTFVGPSGIGGNSFASGGGQSAYSANGGGAGGTNTGGGGGGGGLGAIAGNTGAGGGGGAYAKVRITTGSSFLITVGQGGAGGVAGSSVFSSAGGSGANGKVIIWQFQY